MSVICDMEICYHYTRVPLGADVHNSLNIIILKLDYVYEAEIE